MGMNVVACDDEGGAASPAAAEATTASSLLSLNSAAARSLASALASINRGGNMATLAPLIVELGGHLGTTRMERGSTAAIHAVLARMADPDRYPRDADAYGDKQIGARKQSYFQYKKRIGALQTKDLHTKAQRTSAEERPLVESVYGDIDDLLDVAHEWYSEDWL